MSYIDVDVAVGRRCAAVIQAHAALLDAHVEGESCDLCHVIEAFSDKLHTLSADLLASTEAYALSEREEQANSVHDEKGER